MSYRDSHESQPHKRGLNGRDDSSQPHKRSKQVEIATPSRAGGHAIGSELQQPTSSASASTLPERYVDRAGAPPMAAPKSDSMPLRSALKSPADTGEEEDYDLDLDPDAKTAKLLEESRKRRQAIAAKYASDAPQTAPVDSPKAEHADAAQRPDTFDLSKSSSDLPVKDASAPGEDVTYHQVSAAEYDPDADRAEELFRKQHQSVQPATSAHQDDEYEEVEVTDDEDDMDMFALDEAEAKPKKRIRVLKSKAAPAPNAAPQLKADHAAATGSHHLQSNWDDADGYLRIILGEIVGDRYQISANLGRGMFASVVKARDTQNQQKEVAIKIIRVQETMYKAGLKEIAILEKLNASDAEDKKHVVRLERHFDYKGHLCMVFESLNMNLRDVVRRFGKDVGLNVHAVRTYAHQLFLALGHLEKNAVMHADIKPDNILVNDAKTLLKLCDLGSASDLSEMEITPYLVSRFYRAPEIILGQAYDCSIDVWSTGCTLYELATGKILFPGRTNNHMLLLMQELRGRFTGKQLRKSQLAEQHFDGAQAFLSLEPDKSTGHSVIRRVTIQKPSFDLRARLLPGDTAKQLKPGDLKVTNHLIDFLSRCLELDPQKRLTPKQALAHPFLATS